MTHITAAAGAGGWTWQGREQMRKKIGLVVTFLAVVGSVVAVNTTAASAKAVRCDENNVCKVYCTQTLPNGAWVEYPEGN